VPIAVHAPVPTRRWNVTTLSASSGEAIARTSASPRTLPPSAGASSVIAGGATRVERAPVVRALPALSSTTAL